MQRENTVITGGRTPRAHQGMKDSAFARAAKAFRVRITENFNLDKILWLTGPEGVGKSLALQQFARLVQNLTPFTPDQTENKHRRRQAYAETLKDPPSKVTVIFHDFAAFDFTALHPYAGLALLRKSMSARGISLPLFDLACLIYLQKRGILTPQQIAALVHDADRQYVYPLADALHACRNSEIVATLAKVLQRYGSAGDLSAYLQQIQLEQEIAALFSPGSASQLLRRLPAMLGRDLSRFVAATAGRNKVVLLFDHLEVFYSRHLSQEASGRLDEDWWPRALFSELLEHQRVALGAAAPSIPAWSNRAFRPVSSAQYEIHSLAPVSRQTAAQVIEQMISRERAVRLQVDRMNGQMRKTRPLAFFNTYIDLSITEERRNGNSTWQADGELTQYRDVRDILRRLAVAVDKDVARAMVVLSATTSFDVKVFLHLATAFNFRATEEKFREMCSFSFVLPCGDADRRRFQFQRHVQALLQKFSGGAGLQSHLVLHRYYKKQARRGDPLARALALYHLAGRFWEQGVIAWLELFRETLAQEAYDTCWLLDACVRYFAVPSAYWQGRVCKLRGDFYAALDLVEQADAAYCLAAELFAAAALEKEAAADAAFQEATARFHAASFAFKGRRFEQAVEYAEAALGRFDALRKKDANAIAVYINAGAASALLAEVSLAQEKFTQAALALQKGMQTIEQALERAPYEAACLTARSHLLQIQARLHLASGHLEQAISDQTAAVETIASALHLKQREAQDLALLAEAHANLGNILWRSASYAIALDHFEKAREFLADSISLQPRRLHYTIRKGEIEALIAECHQFLARRENALRALQAAQESCKTALEAEPWHPRALRLYAMLLRARAIQNPRSGAAEASPLRDTLHRLEHLGSIYPENAANAAARSRTHFIAGQLHVSRGQFAKAIAEMRKAAELLPPEEALQRNATNLRLQRVQYHVAIGQILLFIHGADAAQVHLDQARSILLQEEDRQHTLPDRIILQVDCALALADGERQQGNLEGAVEICTNTLKKCDQILDSMPASLSIRLAKARLIETIAEFQTEQAHYRHALENYSAALDLYAAYLREADGETRIHLCKAEIFRRQSEIECLLSNYVHAEELAATAADILAGSHFDDADVDHINQKALLLMQFGVLNEIKGNHAEAEDNFLNAAGLLDRALELAPEHPYFLNNLALAHLQLGRIVETRGETEQSLDRFRKATQLLSQAISGGCQAREISLNLQAGSIHMALAHARAGEWNEAAAQIRNAQKLNEAGRSQAPEDPAFLSYSAGLFYVACDLYQSRGDAARAHHFASRMLEVFNELHAESPNNTLISNNMGNAYQLQASLLMRAGKFKAALEALYQAQRVFDSVLHEKIFDIYILINFGMACLRTGYVHSELEQHERALENFEKAITLFRKGLDYAPSHPICYRNMGDAFLGGGLILRGGGVTDQASQAFTSAIEAYDKVVQVPALGKDFLPNRGKAYTNLGNLHADAGDAGQAIWCYRKAIDDFVAFLEEEPKNFIAAKRLADAYLALGDLQGASSQYQEALASYRLAVEAYERALSLSPHDDEAYYSKAVGLANAAGIYSVLDRPKEARKYYHAALKCYRALEKEGRAHRRMLLNMATTYCCLARIEQAAGKLPDAEIQFKQAVEVFEQAQRQQPDDLEMMLQFAAACNELGKLLLDRQRFAEARERFQDGISAMAGIGETGRTRVVSVELGKAWIGMGDAANQSGDHRRAVEMYQKAGDLLRDCSAEENENAGVECLYHAGIAATRMGEAYETLQEFTQAIACYENGIALLASAYDRAPTDEQIRIAGLEAKRCMQRLRGTES